MDYPLTGDIYTLMDQVKSKTVSENFDEQMDAAEEKNKENFVIVLSLVGIVIFTFLFEARARYLILYVPFFVIAAMLGINKTITFINRQYDKGRLLRLKT